MAKKTATPASTPAQPEISATLLGADLNKLLGVFADPANRKEPAWFENGVRCGKKGLTTIQAIDSAPHLDFEVDKFPSGCFVDEKTFLPDGRFNVLRIPRSPDEKHERMANVTSEYQPLQNRQICELFEGISKRHPVTTIGEFQKGKIFYVCFAAGTSLVKGKDEVLNYFLLKDSKDGKGKTSLVYTPIRVVCWNTFVMALKSATVRLDIPHKGENFRELAFGSTLMMDMESARARSVAVLEKLADAKYNDEQAKRVIAKSLPYPKKPARASLASNYSLEDLDGIEDAMHFLEKSQSSLDTWEYRKARVDIFRKGTELLLERFNDEFPDFAGTGYALWNAVTESADWRRGNAGHAESTLFSYRATEKKDGWNAIVNELKIQTK